MIFPRGGPLPRHPSQLYQAFFEGVAAVRLVLLAVWRLTDGRRRPGLLTGVFCIGYGVARIVGEMFREPDCASSAISWARLAHHGHAAVAAVAGLRRLADRPGLSRQPAAVTPRAVTTRARPADRTTHRAHRPDLDRRLHGRGARPSPPRLLPHARCRSAPPATSRRRRKSRRCSASFWAPGSPSAGWRWAGRSRCASSSSGPAAAP